MANIADVEDAKMGARGKVAKFMATYRANYVKPKRRQALGAMWAMMTPEQRKRMAETDPELHQEIMSYMRD